MSHATPYTDISLSRAKGRVRTYQPLGTKLGLPHKVGTPPSALALALLHGAGTDAAPLLFVSGAL
jgi:hypothetical protein